VEADAPLFPLESGSPFFFFSPLHAGDIVLCVFTAPVFCQRCRCLLPDRRLALCGEESPSFFPFFLPSRRSSAFAFFFFFSPPHSFCSLRDGSFFPLGPRESFFFFAFFSMGEGAGSFLLPVLPFLDAIRSTAFSGLQAEKRRGAFFSPPQQTGADAPFSLPPGFSASQPAPPPGSPPRH